MLSISKLAQAALLSAEDLSPLQREHEPAELTNLVAIGGQYLLISVL